MTKNEIICKIGRVLYGDNWMRRLARDMDCNERQIRRWANNESQARDVTVSKVIEIATLRYAEIGDAIREANRSVK
jgi:transposase-like protein